MWTDKQFWLDSSWRGFRTFCQTLAAMLGGQTVNVLTVDWQGMLGVSAGAALVSLLMSVDRERVVASGGHNVTAVTESGVNTNSQGQASYEGCGSDLR